MSAPDDLTQPTAAASPPEHDPEESFDEEDEGQGPDSDQLRDLLRRASATAPPPPKRDVLAGVQSRLRTRSEGKFYADGWSTREANPRGTYLITAAVMLLLLVVAYWALVPGDIGLSPLGETSLAGTSPIPSLTPQGGESEEG